MSKIKVSELFRSHQGEGRFVGVPSVFLRTFGCNFRCENFGCAPGVKSTEADEIAKNVGLYKTIADVPLAKTGCDSFISWHPEFKHLSPIYDTDALVDMMTDMNPEKTWTHSNGNDTHLVITGGEPLLGWQRAYSDILNHPRMADLQNITFETNGTQEINPDFGHTLLDWALSPVHGKRGQDKITFSVSPKLSASGEAKSEALRPDIIKQYQYYGHTYLKFVVETQEHFNEVDEWVKEYRKAGFTGNVFVMPVGGTTFSYDANRVRVADEALKRGYYYSPRLHVDLWGNSWAA